MFASIVALQLLLPESLQRLPVDPLVKNGSTQFETLQKYFDRAQPISIRELTTHMKGRCYFLDSPTTPVASLLAISTDRSSQGPAFMGDDYRRVTPLIAREADASRLDHLDPEVNREIAKALKRFAGTNAYPVSTRGSLVVEGLRTVDFQRRDYALRKMKNFILLRMTCEEDTYCLNSRAGNLTNRVLASSGESPVTCYYWR